MKVVHLSTSDRGGAGIAASRLHLSLLEQNIDSWFLTLHRFTNDLPQHIKFHPGAGRMFPFMYNGIEKVKRGLRHYHLYTTLDEKLRRKYLKHKPHGFEHFSFPFSDFDISNHPLVKAADVVHLHWVSDGFIDYSKFFSRNDKRVVWTLHDMNPFTGGCHHSDGCLLFRSNCSPCFQLEGTIDPNYAGKLLHTKKNAMMNTSNDAVRIVTPSKWLGDLAYSSSLFNRFQHHVIPNAFHPDQFKMIPREEARRKLNVASDRKVIFVNAHHIDNHRKGLNYLIDALDRLQKKDYLLMSAGHTLRNELFPNLHHLGYLKTTEELSLAYSAADLLVLPSLAENLPNTICESLMCGTPAVAFDTGGIKELINDHNGLLVPLKDSEKLAHAIETIASKKWDRDLIRKNAIEQFGNKKVAVDYVKVYNDFKMSR